MKILMVHQDRDELYGAVHSMFELLTHLNCDWGVEPVILTPKKGVVTDYCEKMGWEYHTTGHANFVLGGNTFLKRVIRTLFYPVFFLRYKIKNFLALRLASKYINFDEIDLIHTNVNVCDVGALLAKKFQKPHFWHLREFGDADYNRISFRKNFIPFMNTHTTCFVAISKAVQKHWIKNGLDERKVVQIYNGVEVVETNPKPALNEDEPLKIVFTGSISQSKGQYLLIEAVHRLNDDLQKKVCIDIIGGGPSDYVNELKRKVQLYKLDSCVHFLGYKSNVRELLGRYDIGMMCSRAEAFGRVTIENMMAGLCVIASDSGANLELIKNRENGLFFHYPDVDSLKEQLEFAIMNRNTIRKIGLSAQNYALSNFTSAINAANVYKAYQRVLGDNNHV